MKLFTMLQARYVVRSQHRFARSCLACAVLFCLGGRAFSADCEMTLTNTEVDYGVLSREDMTIRGNEEIDLGSRQLLLTTVCHKPELIGLRFEGEPKDKDAYKFAGNGRFTVKLSNANLDGVAVQLSRTSSSGNTGVAAKNSLYLLPNEKVIPVLQGEHAKGKIFTGHITIQTYIDENSTRVRDVTKLVGSGSLNLDVQ